MVVEIIVGLLELLLASDIFSDRLFKQKKGRRNIGRNRGAKVGITFCVTSRQLGKVKNRWEIYLARVWNKYMGSSYRIKGR